ncbi:MAG TPA: hypothetical protein VLB68_32895 [Pyrinomonadaceae bacterium]|nr:hypothetical protein [Pyrinomonadaceae bacterium]
MKVEEYLLVFIGNLRKKLESDTLNKRYLLTEPWIGYGFNPSGTQVFTSRNGAHRSMAALTRSHLYKLFMNSLHHLYKQNRNLP